MTIRVVLAEDDALLREGIARMIGADDDFELVGVASDCPELIELIDRDEPDVVITDIRMTSSGTDEGIRAANGVREHRPKIGAAVLSQYTASAYALALLEEGSVGPISLRSEWPAPMSSHEPPTWSRQGGWSLIRWWSRTGQSALETFHDRP